jgi:predicted transcriptional regulator
MKEYKEMQEEKRKEFIELVTPIMKWMAENLHPHTKIIIEANSAELVEGDISYVNNEFLVD